MALDALIALNLLEGSNYRTFPVIILHISGIIVYRTHVIVYRTEGQIIVLVR